jgi:hypothetical protein
VKLGDGAMGDIRGRRSRVMLRPRATAGVFRAPGSLDDGVGAGAGRRSLATVDYRAAGKRRLGPASDFDANSSSPSGLPARAAEAPVAAGRPGGTALYRARPTASA